MDPVKIDVAKILSGNARVTIVEILVDADVERGVDVDERTLRRVLRRNRQSLRRS